MLKPINYYKGNFGKAWKRYGSYVFLTFALVITFLILILDGKQLLTYSFRLNPAFVLLSILTVFSGLFVTVQAWRSILARFGSRLSYKDDLRIYCYTLLGAAIPGGFWSLVGRVALYERQRMSGVNITVASVIEFMLLGLAGLVVYGLTMFIQPAQSLWQRPEIAFIVTTTALTLVQPPLFNRLIRLVLRYSRQSETFTSLSYSDLGLWLILEILTVIIGGTAIYVLLQSFIEIPPAEAYVLVVSAWAASAASNLLFWFPGKPLLRDGIMALVLTRLLPPALALAFVVILRVWTIVSILLAAGLAWLFLRRKTV